jgi:hypothetical protein
MPTGLESRPKRSNETPLRSRTEVPKLCSPYARTSVFALHVGRIGMSTASPLTYFGLVLGLVTVNLVASGRFW